MLKSEADLERINLTHTTKPLAELLDQLCDTVHPFALVNQQQTTYHGIDGKQHYAYADLALQGWPHRQHNVPRSGLSFPLELKDGRRSSRRTRPMSSGHQENTA